MLFIFILYKKNWEFKYLFKVVDNFIDEYKIDFTLNIDTNTDIVIPILNKKYEKYITDNKITITIHDESKMNHPYELTEKHRYLNMFIDIFFINGQPFYISKTKKINFILPHRS